MLSQLENWLSNNNLIDQEKKRQEILFRRNDRMYDKEYDRGNTIKTICLLGIHLDENLKWKDHIFHLTPEEIKQGSLWHLKNIRNL